MTINSTNAPHSAPRQIVVVAITGVVTMPLVAYILVLFSEARWALLLA